MPGLNQLQKFYSDLMNLGDEIKIRAARGEKPSTIAIPSDVSPEDDSEIFKNGLPQLSEEEQAQADAEAAEKEKFANDFSDITGEGEEESEAATAQAEPVLPNVSDLLTPAAGADIDDFDLSEFEEPEKPKEPPKPKVIPLEDMDLDALLAPTGNEDQLPESEQEQPFDFGLASKSPAQAPEDAEEIPEEIEEISDVEPLESIGGGTDFDMSVLSGNSASKPASQSDMAPADEFSFDQSVLESSGGRDSFAGLTDDVPPVENVPQSSELGGLDDLGGDFGLDDFSLDAASDSGQEPGVKETSELDSLGDFGDFGSDDSVEQMDSMGSGMDGEVFDFSSSLPADLKESIPESDLISDEEAKKKFKAARERRLKRQNSESEEQSLMDDDLSMPAMDDSGIDGLPDFGDMGDMDGFDMDETPSESPAPEKTVDIDFNDISEPDHDRESQTKATEPESETSSEDAGFSFGDVGEPQKSEQGESSGFDFDTSGLDGEFGGSDGLGDLPDFDDSAMGDDPFASGEPSGSSFDFGGFGDSASSVSDSGNSSAADTSSMDFGIDSGVDISPDDSVPETGDSDDGAVESFDTSAIDGMDFTGEADEGGSDFELGGFSSGDDDDLFNIPGFSDTVGTAQLEKEKPKVATPDFSGAVESKKQKNSFTDAEYRRFQENLREYPLNVRIALEDLVVKNEFTDDAVFAILEKVLRKVPARNLASELEKMLDQTIEVPRDFERRTAQEYENYKKSFEYQVKNRIIPGAIITTAIVVMVGCLMILFTHFIYKPARASSLYRQGYSLIDKNEYDESQKKFDMALTYKPVKKWFYKYAQSYREHNQFDRATLFYNNILMRYSHEKKAGLELADMTKNDMFNYPETERILKREVLDYHINDPEGLMALGDLYLDWAGDSDPEKYPLAKENYDKLLNAGGKVPDSNTRQARQMRYWICVDNLDQVLAYKNEFYPNQKSLKSEDWIELSGYLLDKRYGKLTPAEEELRGRIQDLRPLLELALKTDQDNPVGLYNYGRYFVETKDSVNAKNFIGMSLQAFASQRVRGKADTYRYIDACRIMGELYAEGKEYIDARKNYNNGIAIFENAHQSSGFAPVEKIGKLYADLGDLDYFDSGEMDEALANYVKSIENKNDTPNVRYKIGFIQYNKKNYAEALGSFIKTSEVNGTDTHLLLALANTLCLRGDNMAAQGYYQQLEERLNQKMSRFGVVIPQVRADHADIVETYMKGTNNLGVSLYRQASLRGDSEMNGRAMVSLEKSLKAWDALTRNPETMVRIQGSNLAEQNFKYMTNEFSDFEPQIYQDIPRTMEGEKPLE